MEIISEQVKKFIGNKEILKGINIDVKNKEFLGIIGPNGSGKSTFLKCIYRILKPSKANDVCTGASCLDAFYNKKGFFTQYTNDDTKLVAFWTCNGCDEVLLNNQEGLLEKLERILSVKTDIVHVGICTEIIDEQTHKKVLCPKIQEIVDFLQKNNIKVVFGTHK